MLTLTSTNLHLCKDTKLSFRKGATSDGAYFFTITQNFHDITIFGTHEQLQGIANALNLYMEVVQ